MEPTLKPNIELAPKPILLTEHNRGDESHDAPTHVKFVPTPEVHEIPETEKTWAPGETATETPSSEALQWAAKQMGNAEQGKVKAYDHLDKDAEPPQQESSTPKAPPKTTFEDILGDAANASSEGTPMQTSINEENNGKTTTRSILQKAHSWVGNTKKNVTKTTSKLQKTSDN
ncbi:hypothetical protein BDV95DRAFT_599166 [Massariosphaeria phaeospora]|uniref:Uncharacterized protein n=1 Tax=Massariosphaeria phaeospora TaxID=100035 RepID=A0A7C8I278_9PLEO|nr:hypothetical protein BDV95DRAFT_599166 [Massariosphaeria phaeospora]